MASMVSDQLTTLNEALVRTLDEIVAQRGILSLFKHVARWVGQVLPFDVLLFSVDYPDRQSTTLHIVENGKVRSQVIPSDVDYQQWIEVPHIAKESDLPTRLKLWLDRGIQSYCSVPLSTAHLSLGAVGVGTERKDAYTQQALKLLRPVAVQVAFAIHEELTYHRPELVGANRPESENLHSLLERSPDYAIVMVDSNGKVLTWNTGAELLAGFRPGEIVGQDFAEIFPLESTAQLKAGLRAAAEQGRHEREHWLVRRDGSRIWTNMVITALRDSSGRACRFLTVSRDFTQRKLAEEALLVGIADILGTNSDIRYLVSLVSATIHLSPHDVVSIAMYNATLDRLELIFGPTQLTLKRDELTESLEQTPAELAFRSCKAVCFDRCDDDRLPRKTTMQLLSQGVRSGLWVPLVNDDRVIGVLGITSAREGAFVDVNTNLVAQVASLVALAVGNNPASFSTHQELEADKVARYEFGEIVHRSVVVTRILKQVETVAPMDATVLILGETGTGKELIAHAIHCLSGRRQHAFVKLNCAAIPSGLLESELFGHEKGAFTGAICQKMGRMEMADRGTLFLDEVGDIPLELQPKLLRALQEREFERLGSARTIRVDTRLIAATNRNLEEMVEARQFRADLYYRLKVFPIVIPPLRDRPEDIPLLSMHFTRKHAKRMGKRVEIIPPEVMEALKRWHWPGNVRELENLIERAVILSQGRILNIPTAEIKAERSTRPRPYATATLENAEREAIICALRRTGAVIGGRNGAAAQLGLKRTTLNSKMRKLGITRNSL
jgi:PAS domain S-box-containing protein